MVEGTRENEIGKMAEEAFRRESAEEETFKPEVRCCGGCYRFNRRVSVCVLLLFPGIA